ncbi:MAG: MarR family transcriptional regulator [Nitrosopumilus sp.]|nr:MarR family transcriptional regulator [Nitrosopumilus sp.]NNL59443.1 MarR family transcriptional regulator [Nitrosopumilus sp.]
MLVEIPDPEVILGVILAFFVGLGGLYFYFKVRPFIKTKSEMGDISQSERLEYYERQLIDMKIRLDALEIQGIEQKTETTNTELKQILEQITNINEKEKKVVQEPLKKVVPEKDVSTPKVSNPDYSNPIDFVLHQITNKPMTSRDIQITLKKSREHTSRLMKKLFDDGYVERNTETKPYTYSITEKGRSKIGGFEINPTVV